MTCRVPTVHKSIKEPGGTRIVTVLILTAYISTDHILRMPMGSSGTTSEVIIIHLNVLK